MTTFAKNISLRAISSPDFAVRQDVMQRFADEGWQVAEIAMMFNMSESWTRLVLGDRARRFFCKGCNQPALKKNAACPTCDANTAKLAAQYGYYRVQDQPSLVRAFVAVAVQ